MKRTTKLFFAAFNLALLFVFLLSSCDKMDDIQKKFSDREEIVYLGKVDSVKAYPGFGKVKLVWQMTADPKVEQTIIYWNLRRDSVVKPFNRTAAGQQIDSIVLENMPEGPLIVEFRNVNSNGETSLISLANATVWGEAFADGLRARTLSTLDFDYTQSKYNLVLSPATLGDSVVYSEIKYTTKSNEEKRVRVERTEDSVALLDFPDGGALSFRSVFFPPQGIDTVYGADKVFRAPKAMFDQGTKIALAGKADSRYFNFNGDFCEWNSNGDLIIYTVAADGTLTEKEQHPAIAPRATFRELFFYDADRFIAVKTDNKVYMYQFAGGALNLIKTPAGADALGTGFTMPAFIPARGFFFSHVPASGELKTWLAFNDATWGAPNGGTVTATIKFPYTVNTLLNYETLLGVDTEGYLRSIPVLASGSLGSVSRSGMGWSRFTKLVSIGTKLYGLEASGDFYVFNNFNAADDFLIVN
ncbi:DUF4998 domain-containing protein [Niabella aurantiaca]|uniref:DUF4998 domain-containing protein n=1 Tax=Niabella aurantiaca TaxID=379900 RepID=UPI00036BE1C9|nr:DUF4998 domain-containing protein [Niabella aurantiaca]